MRRGFALVPLFALLIALAGCPGNVEFSELDKFGSVRSAVWLELIVNDPEGERTTHVLMLNSRPGLCKAYQTALPEMVTYNDRIWEVWQDIYDDYDYYDYYGYPDYSELCEVYADYWGFMATELDRFYGEGANAVSLYLTEVTPEEVEWNVAPEDGIWDAMPAWEDRDVGRYFDLTVARYSDNPFRIMANRYGDIDPYYACFGYGDDYYDDLMNAVDYYYLDEADGTAEITMKALNKAKVDFAAGIVDEDQNSAGTLDASFTATRCQVNIETDQYFYMYWYF